MYQEILDMNKEKEDCEDCEKLGYVCESCEINNSFLPVRVWSDISIPTFKINMPDNGMFKESAKLEKCEDCVFLGYKCEICSVFNDIEPYAVGLELNPYDLININHTFNRLGIINESLL